MSQSDHMFNPTDCQMFTLCLMHLTHILENAFMFHYLYANTSAFNHLFEPHATLSKILPNICTSFSTSSTFTPSYSCLVPHNPRLVYIIIQYGYMTLCFLNSSHGPALSFQREVNTKELEFLSPHCICFTFSSFHSLKFSELKCKVSEFPVHRMKTLALLEDARNEDMPLGIFLIWLNGSTFKHPFLYSHSFLKISSSLLSGIFYTGFCI